jgi:hypothetical protein
VRTIFTQTQLRQYFKTFKEPFQGIDSTSLSSLAGLYNNPIPTQFLATRDSSKILNCVQNHERNNEHGTSTTSWNKISKFFIPDWRDIVDPGTGLSCRPAWLHRLAGRYDNSLPESTISHSSGTRNLATCVVKLHTPPYTIFHLSAPPPSPNLPPNHVSLSEYIRLSRLGPLSGGMEATV